MKAIGQKSFRYKHSLNIGKLRIGVELYSHTTRRFGFSFDVEASYDQRINSIRLSASEPVTNQREQTSSFRSPSWYYNPGHIELTVLALGRRRILWRREFDSAERKREYEEHERKSVRAS